MGPFLTTRDFKLFFVWMCLVFFFHRTGTHKGTNSIFRQYKLRFRKPFPARLLFFSNIYLKEALEVLICVSFGAVAIPVFFLLSKNQERLI